MFWSKVLLSSRKEGIDLGLTRRLSTPKALILLAACQFQTPITTQSIRKAGLPIPGLDLLSYHRGHVPDSDLGDRMWPDRHFSTFGYAAAALPTDSLPDLIAEPRIPRSAHLPGLKNLAPAVG